MMKKGDSTMNNTSKNKIWSGLLAVVVLFSLVACSGATSQPALATITSPVTNAEVLVGDNVPIVGQVTGQNIVRVDVVVDSATHATLSADDKSKGVENFPVQVDWAPALAGVHFVQLNAYGPDDQLIVKSDAVIFTAKAKPAAPTQPPEPTATLAPSTPVPTSTPAAADTLTTTTTTTDTAAATALTPTLTITNDFANVRSGPGTDYALLGQLELNTTVPVRGKNSDGTWWQIAYEKGTDGAGWVRGDLGQANNVTNVPVAEAPPLPTSAPATAVPPNTTGTTTDATPVPAAAEVTATPSGPVCNETVPEWRGSNPNYPFCATQDLTWVNPQSEWTVYDNGKDIPLGLTWSLYGDNIASVWMRMDQSDSACEFARPAQRTVNEQVPAAGTYNFNAGNFPYGGTYRVYLSVQLKDGRVVSFGEKKLCIR